MVPFDMAENVTGHIPGGISLFALKEGVKVYLDVSLRHFDICCKEKNISVEYIKKNVKDGRRKEYFISIIEKNK